LYFTVPGFSAKTLVKHISSLLLLRLLALLLSVELMWWRKDVLMLMLLLVMVGLWLMTGLSDRQVPQLSRVVVKRAGGCSVVVKRAGCCSVVVKRACGYADACPTQRRTFGL